MHTHTLCICSEIPYLFGMIGNYFTLRHIVTDLRRDLTGKTISEIFTQSRNELIVSSGEISLVVSCEPSANACYLRTRVSRAKRNSMDCFRRIHGAVIQSVHLQETDREIVIGIGNGAPLSLIIQLFGPKANVFLTEKRRVLDAFLQARAWKGRELDPPRKPRPAYAENEFAAAIQAIGQISAGGVLKSLYPLFGSLLVRECLVRADIAESTPVAGLTPDGIARLHREIKQLTGELHQHPSPRIYKDHRSLACFSIIGLQMMHDLDCEVFDSVHEGIRAFLGGTRRQRGFDRELSALRTTMETEMRRIERTLAVLSREVSGAERANAYELYGKLLLAFPRQPTPGVKRVGIENVFSPEKELVEIPLDPHLTATQNAQRYFDRARKARHALAESAERKADYHERYDRLKTLLDALGAVHTTEQWEEFKRSRTAELAAAGLLKKTTDPRKDLPPFRIFTVEGGFQVWAGKNSENNDLLTMRHAKPNDLWFHARGAGGSHVVLRAGTGKGEISKRAIEQTASIAAYYSKMKNSGLVPVAMTLRKYVRKPRGAPAGTVRLEREDVLMVPPRLPQGQES